MNSLQIINQQQILEKDFKVYGTVENPLFLAKDVATWIEHSRASEMLKGIDDEEKLMQTILASGQNREMWFLTEDGFYEVLMQSKKPIAKKFKKEVKKVLKQIRTTGGYIPIDENMSDSEIMARALQISQKTIEEKNNALREEKYKNIVLEQEKEENKSKVLFSEAVENSNDLVLVKEMATMITQSGFKIGQNELFEYLRKYSYLCSKKGGLYNLPTKKYEHLFKITKRNIQHTNSIEVKNTTKINGKGQLYFAKKFVEHRLNGLTTKDLLKNEKEAM